VAEPIPAGSPLPEELLQRMAGNFGMLAATARLQIMWLLSSGERDVGTLAEETGQTVAGVSQHLAKLRLAGLVTVRRAGRHHIYLIDDAHVVDVIRVAAGQHSVAGERRDGVHESA
jgi:DNA-binding transcriptional ArsR family regulator